jgi:hypothetical protein
MLLIVDELTAGLDPADHVRSVNPLSELAERGVIVLLFTQAVEDGPDSPGDSSILHCFGLPKAAAKSMSCRFPARVTRAPRA